MKSTSNNNSKKTTIKQIQSSTNLYSTKWRNKI